MKQNIGVIIGGPSPEHDISILTGLQVARILEEKHKISIIHFNYSCKFLFTPHIYQYHYKLPWIARIANRQDSGEIVEEWVMVEDIQDVVLCMDPYPWDDIEEDFKLSTQEFLIRWKLCGFAGLYITKP